MLQDRPVDSRKTRKKLVTKVSVDFLQQQYTTNTVCNCYSIIPWATTIHNKHRVQLLLNYTLGNNNTQQTLCAIATQLYLGQQQYTTNTVCNCYSIIPWATTIHNKHCVQLLLNYTLGNNNTQQTLCTIATQLYLGQQQYTTNTVCNCYSIIPWATTIHNKHRVQLLLNYTLGNNNTQQTLCAIATQLYLGQQQYTTNTVCNCYSIIPWATTIHNKHRVQLLLNYTLGNNNTQQTLCAIATQLYLGQQQYTTNTVCNCYSIIPWATTIHNKHCVQLLLNYTLGNNNTQQTLCTIATQLYLGQQQYTTNTVCNCYSIIPWATTIHNKHRVQLLLNYTLGNNNTQQTPCAIATQLYLGQQQYTTNTVCNCYSIIPWATTIHNKHCVQLLLNYTLGNNNTQQTPCAIATQLYLGQQQYTTNTVCNCYSIIPWATTIHNKHRVQLLLNYTLGNNNTQQTLCAIATQLYLGQQQYTTNTVCNCYSIIPWATTIHNKHCVQLLLNYTLGNNNTQQTLCTIATQLYLGQQQYTTNTVCNCYSIIPWATTIHNKHRVQLLLNYTLGNNNTQQTPCAIATQLYLGQQQYTTNTVCNCYSIIPWATTIHNKHRVQLLLNYTLGNNNTQQTLCAIATQLYLGQQQYTTNTVCNCYSIIPWATTIHNKHRVQLLLNYTLGNNNTQQTPCAIATQLYLGQQQYTTNTVCNCYSIIPWATTIHNKHCVQLLLNYTLGNNNTQQTPCAIATQLYLGQQQYTTNTVCNCYSIIPWATTIHNKHRVQLLLNYTLGNNNTQQTLCAIATQLYLGQQQYTTNTVCNCYSIIPWATTIHNKHCVQLLLNYTLGNNNTQQTLCAIATQLYLGQQQYTTNTVCNCYSIIPWATTIHNKHCVQLLLNYTLGNNNTQQTMCAIATQLY